MVVIGQAWTRPAGNLSEWTRDQTNLPEQIKQALIGLVPRLEDNMRDRNSRLTNRFIDKQVYAICTI